MAAMKLQWQAVDARPIKKLAEAKARKKRKTDKAYQNLIKRANAALDAEEEVSKISAAERATALFRLVQLRPTYV